MTRVGMREGNGADACLLAVARQVEEQPLSRRHEEMMVWAELELSLPRGEAERVYAVAEQESLEPGWAFQLIRCGVGVVELEAPEPDAEGALEQGAPAWVTTEVSPEAAARERHMRLSFRRLRAHLERGPSTVEAVRGFLAEPDVGDYTW